jgi:hypothetical protein
MWVARAQSASRKARVGAVVTYSSRFRGRKRRSSSLHGGDSILSGRGSPGRGLERLTGVLFDRVLDGSATNCPTTGEFAGRGFRRTGDWTATGTDWDDCDRNAAKDEMAMEARDDDFW